MNPSQYAQQPQQLFGSQIHAGGWPKLGWATQDAADESLSLDDELDSPMED